MSIMNISKIPQLGLPIRAPEKCIALTTAILGGAAIGTLGSLIAGASANRSNANATAATNDANLRIAQMNNAFNRQERLESQEWNRQQWLEQQKFNSPLMQAERLRAAGINPGQVLDGEAAQSVGQIAASTPASAAAVAPMQVAHYNPIFTASDASNLASSFAGAFKTMNEGIGIAKDNETRSQMNIAMYDNLIADLRLKAAQKDVSKIHKKLLLKQVEQAEIAKLHAQFDLDKQQQRFNMEQGTWASMMQQMSDAHKRADIETKSLQLAYDFERKYGNELRSWQVKKLQSEVSKAFAEVGLLNAQKGLSSAQMYKTFADRAKVIAEKIGIDKQNAHFDNIVNDIEATLHLQGQQAIYEYGMNNTFGGGIVRDIKHFGRNVIQPLSPFSGFIK